MKSFAEVIAAVCISTTMFGVVVWLSLHAGQTTQQDEAGAVAGGWFVLPARGGATPPLVAGVGELLDAIRWVETSDMDNPPDGDGGRSIGPYQIQRAYWQDSGVPGSYEDCRDAEYARRVVMAYWRRWVPEALENYDPEVLARTHNGGPRGATKAATEPYWERVKGRLDAR